MPEHLVKQNEAADDLNSRETGARKFPLVPEEHDRDRDGALAQVEGEGLKRGKMGLTEGVDETQDKTRQSDTRGRGTGG